MVELLYFTGIAAVFALMAAAADYGPAAYHALRAWLGFPPRSIR